MPDIGKQPGDAKITLPSVISSRKVLIIGSSHGIGRAIVQCLFRSGYQIIAVDKEASRLKPRPYAFIKTDLLDDSQLETLCTKVKSSVNDLWAIVYCAGVYHPNLKFDKYTLRQWDDVHAVNCRSAFFILQQLCGLVVKGGRIVTVVSGAAHIGSRDIAYSASKACLLGLTKSLALNLSPRGILVNSVCPGPISTRMSSQMHPDRVSDYKKRIQLGRFGKPSEVASTVQFLLSPENTFMVGATLDTNGGLYMR